MKSAVHNEVVTYIPCPVCGQGPSDTERIPYTKSLSGFTWTAVGPNKTVASSTWSGFVPSGDGTVDFHVVGLNDCGACRCEADGSVPFTVHRLAVSRQDWVGLDRTDTGRATLSQRTLPGVALLDPSAPNAAYSWTSCGICKFDGVTDGQTVHYCATNSEMHSSSYLDQPLTVESTITDTASGQSVTTSCTTNFTVVKVDVQVDGVSEEDEETQGVFVPYTPDAADGSWTNQGTNGLVAVNITCNPSDLPESETVVISCPVGFLYEKTGEAYSPAASTYKVCEISGKEFFLHGASHVQAQTLRVEHPTSGAVDEIRFSSCEMCFVTPFGDPGERTQERDSGDGQNEFTFDDASEQLRVNLKVRVSADASAFSEVTGHFSMPAIGRTTLSWIDNNGNTGNPKATKAGEDWMFKAVACYNGYPLHNADFGRKTVIFEMGGSSIETEFEVFFPSDGHNHPACSTCANCPNWFYYWREGQVCEIPNGVVYGGNTDPGLSGRFDYRFKTISLFSGTPLPRQKIDARRSEWEILIIPPITNELEGVVLVIEESVTSNRVYKETFCVGAEGAGIRSVAATVKHEICHKNIAESFPDEIEVIFDEEDTSAFKDSDEDYVLDSDERTGRWGIVTEVGMSDTFEINLNFRGSEYAKYGDNEVQARIAEERTLEDSYHCELDWCNPGCQSKNRRGPMW